MKKEAQTGHTGFGFLLVNLMKVSLIIFVCTSNTCRSPMAEQFGTEWLVDKKLEGQYKIISRGLTDRYEPPNSVASANAVYTLSENYCLDLSQHRSALLSSDEVDEAYLIIGVTQSHRDQIVVQFPNSSGKVQCLNSDVGDPWHASVAVYSACAHVMKRLVHEILTQLIES